jgi:hypothetical protein
MARGPIAADPRCGRRIPSRAGRFVLDFTADEVLVGSNPTRSRSSRSRFRMNGTGRPFPTHATLDGAKA